MILFIYQIQTALVVLYRFIMNHLISIDNRTRFQEFILDTTNKISTTPIRIEMLDRSKMDDPDAKIPTLIAPIPMDVITLAFAGDSNGEEFIGNADDKARFMSLWKEFQCVVQSNAEQLVYIAVDCTIERIREIGYWVACIFTLVLGVGSWYMYLTSPSVLVRAIALALFTYDMTSSIIFLVCYVMRIPAMRHALDFYHVRRHPVVWKNGDNIIKVTIQ